MTDRSTVRRRLRRYLLWLVSAWLLLTVLPVLLFRVVPVPTSAFMLQYQFGGWGQQRPPLRHQWVPAQEISDQARLAVLAAEDQRFAEHHGFDVAAIRAALRHNERSQRTRGASTISQQLAKNLFLWPGRTWLRKGLEVYFTALIEITWSKQRILTVYLNCVEFGPGIYGVEAAAQAYFGRPAAALGPHQAALLAAVLPNPRRLSVAQPSAYVRSRAAWIQRQMRRLGPAALATLG